MEARRSKDSSESKPNLVVAVSDQNKDSEDQKTSNPEHSGGDQSAVRHIIMTDFITLKVYAYEHQRTKSPKCDQGPQP